MLNKNLVFRKFSICTDLFQKINYCYNYKRNDLFLLAYDSCIYCAVSGLVMVIFIVF